MKPSLAVLEALLLAAMALLHGADQPSSLRPNVVVVSIDDQGCGELSCHGDPVLQTPH